MSNQNFISKAFEVIAKSCVHNILQKQTKCASGALDVFKKSLLEKLALRIEGGYFSVNNQGGGGRPFFCNRESAAFASTCLKNLPNVD